MSFQYASWPLPAGVYAGWTTRLSGHSQAPFGSNNIAQHVGDDAIGVNRNRALLQQRLAGSPVICWLNQTHSTCVVDVAAADSRVGQDGCYTQQPLHACAVMTADCLPVFFWTHCGQQIAAVHAGWRGLANGILLSALQVFAQPTRVICGIGPAISAQAFEVGEDVVAAFQHWPVREEAFVPAKQAGKFWCDLPMLAEQQLRSAGVSHVYQARQCTYSNPALFYSYRRDGQTGRMANLIWKLP